MKQDDLIEHSAALETLLEQVDEQEVAGCADSMFLFDNEPSDQQDVFDAGFELAVLLAKAREDGTEARVYYAHDPAGDYRFFFIAKSEEEVLSRVSALKAKDA